MNKSVFVFQFVDGLMYINLGKSELVNNARTMLTRLYGGHTIQNDQGDILYYNGTPDNKIYLDHFTRCLHAQIIA